MKEDLRHDEQLSNDVISIDDRALEYAVERISQIYRTVIMSAKLLSTPIL